MWGFVVVVVLVSCSVWFVFCKHCGREGSSREIEDPMCSYEMRYCVAAVCTIMMSFRAENEKKRYVKHGPCIWENSDCDERNRRDPSA